jgi:maleylacetate reductase
MSLHHKLCHTLGGTLDLLDVPTHTVVLLHALGYDQPAPRSLAELGRTDNEIPRITELAIAVPYAKPPTDHPRRCRGGAPSRMARRTAPHLLVAP